MKKQAQRALDVLAMDIHNGAALWPMVDRIERRFRVFGYTERRLRETEHSAAQWQAGWMERNVHYDMRRPYYPH